MCWGSDNAQNDSPCEGCHYWRDMFICYGCHYLLVENKMRGCPPGAGCTKRKPLDLELLQKENKAIHSHAVCGFTHEYV